MEKLKLVLGGLLLGLLLAEGILRLRGGLPDFHRRPPGRTYRFAVKAGVMRGVPAATEFRVNSLGLRGPELPPRGEAYRVLAVGGSTTECLYLSEEQAWPERVRRGWTQGGGKPPLWVGNAGISAYSTRHHRELVLSDSLVDEVDELWLLVGVNDLRHACSGWETQVLANLEARRREGPWEKLHLVRTGRRALGRLTREESVIELETFDGSAYVLRRDLRRREPRRRPLPELGVALKAYGARLREIVQLARVRGPKPVLMTQPVLWREGLPAEEEALLWMGILPDGSYLSTEALAEGMRRFNRVTRRIAGELEVELIDLAREVADPGDFYDDCHFTPTGSARVAEVLLRHLRSRPARAFQGGAPRG